MSETLAPEGIIGNTLSSFSTQISRKYGSFEFIISLIAVSKSSRFYTPLALILKPFAIVTKSGLTISVEA